MDQKWMEAINRQLDSVHPNVSANLSELCDFPDAVRVDVVGLLLQYACQSQHVGNITAARKAMSAIPRPCLSTVLEVAIQKSVDLADDWEYRRLLELLQEIGSNLLPQYIDRGHASGDLAIREVADDFSVGSNVEYR